MANVVRTRTELVRALVEHTESISSLMEELRTYGWDSEEDLVTLKPEHITRVLSKYQSCELSASEVIEWANAIDRREDIGLQASHKNTLDEMVFWLANPDINFGITNELASLVISNLESNNVV
jgi:hypothetical protein